MRGLRGRTCGQALSLTTGSTHGSGEARAQTIVAALQGLGRVVLRAVDAGLGSSLSIPVPVQADVAAG